MAITSESLIGAVRLHWPLTDEQSVELCALNPELRFEYTCTGDLIIMTSTSGWTGNRNARLVSRLQVWAEDDGSGLVFDSSTIFLLPNRAKRMPDASRVRLDRWNALTREQQDGYRRSVRTLSSSSARHQTACRSCRIRWRSTSTMGRIWDGSSIPSNAWCMSIGLGRL